MKLAILSTSRADWSYYLPIIELAAKHDEMEVQVLKGRHGYADVPDWAAKYVYPLMAEQKGDTPDDVAAYSGKLSVECARLFSVLEPDVLVVLGDRHEMLAGALAALPFRTPIAHLHGGEETLGAIDNSIRYAISSIATYHFPATGRAATRLRQTYGYKHVYMVGSTGLDNLRKQMSEKRLEPKHVLVGYHPTTLEEGDPGRKMHTILGAIPDDMPVMITMPNYDVGYESIREAILSEQPRFHHCAVVESLGHWGYVRAMEESYYMLGNSSSAFIEAEFLGIPAINVGSRQQGREFGLNVINCGYDQAEIRKAIEKANRNKLVRFNSVYGDGFSAKRILSLLEAIV